MVQRNCRISTVTALARQHALTLADRGINIRPVGEGVDDLRLQTRSVTGAARRSAGKRTAIGTQRKAAPLTECVALADRAGGVLIAGKERGVRAEIADIEIAQLSNQGTPLGLIPIPAGI